MALAKWTDFLNQDVYERFCNCTTKKEDLQDLVFNFCMFDPNGQKMHKEDALVYILEWLDCNSCDIDMTRDEYKQLVDSLV